MSDHDKQAGGRCRQRHLAIIQGLQIFAEAECWGVHAGHDQIKAGPDDASKLTAEQRNDLMALGWFDDDESWGFFT